MPADMSAAVDNNMLHPLRAQGVLLFDEGDEGYADEEEEEDGFLDDEDEDGEQAPSIGCNAVVMQLTRS